MNAERDLGFEDALSEDWSRDLDVKEVPLDRMPSVAVGGILLLAAIVIAGRIFFLGTSRGAFYEYRSLRNLNAVEHIPAPRGIVTDRFGTPLATNKPAFSLVLHIRPFSRDASLRSETIRVLRETLGLTEDELQQSILDAGGAEVIDTITLATDLTQEQVVRLKAMDLASLSVVDGTEREYEDPVAFSSLLGYVGFPTAKELETQGEALTGQDLVGKAGVESFYDELLQGKPGSKVKTRNAKGETIVPITEESPNIGTALTLTIDAGLQEYFAHRFQTALVELGRVSGVGLAIDPRNGEVLAFINFPSFDNNILSRPGHREEKQEILNSPSRPLFVRAVGGLYNPGSTIKPLVAVAALAERVIDPSREIFSPGYLEIPNPYQPDKPTRYADWRYQGNVNLAAAIAQSSNVYFYTVGGGTNSFPGLGIKRLREWWERFALGRKTGIDFPGETDGFLPSPEWKEKTAKRAWLLGDTYNVSIGQGDLLVTPIQLLSYIGAVANGGKIYQPVLNKENSRGTVSGDLSSLTKEIREVQQGMRKTITSSLGGAHLMNDLPIQVAGKTGTAQIENNQKVNAFFVGYAPYEDPQIAILVLVENAKEGSLNAIPMAKDVFSWYYENRIKKPAQEVRE